MALQITVVKIHMQRRELTGVFFDVTIVCIVGVMWRSVDLLHHEVVTKFGMR